MLCWSCICILLNVSVAGTAAVFAGGSWYCTLLNRANILGLRTKAGTEFEDIAKNLAFNEFGMAQYCERYDMMMGPVKSNTVLARRTLTFLLACIAVIYVLPIRITLLVAGCIIPIRSFPFYSKGSGPSGVSLSPTRSPDTPPVKRIVVEVFENQRWWLGGWSDKGLTIGTDLIFAWSDLSCRFERKKSEETPGLSWSWDGLWHVDSVGWMYSRNFTTDMSAYQAEQGPSHFVRRRRWIRVCVWNDS